MAFDELTQSDIARLARAVAMDIKDVPEILKDFQPSLTRSEFARVEQIDFYKRTLEQFITEWQSVKSTADRFRIGALAVLEDTLPMIGGRMGNDREPLAAVVDAGKFLANAGGLNDASKQGSGPSTAAEKFTITINLGADVERYEKSIAVGPSEVQIAKGKGEEVAVKAIPDPSPVAEAMGDRPK